MAHQIPSGGAGGGGIPRVLPRPQRIAAQVLDPPFFGGAVTAMRPTGTPSFSLSDYRQSRHPPQG
jgi:hypothetical protein